MVFLFSVLERWAAVFSSEGFVEGQHAGLAHALERSPVEGVLTRRLSGGLDLHIAHAKARGVLLEQPHLLVV